MEAKLITIHEPRTRRFEALLDGNAREPFDRSLLDRGDWLVAPTLGAVIPGWLLALPREPILSFRDWAASGGRAATDVVCEVCDHLGLRTDEVIWFEHGPVQPGTVVGCGLDHAHVHILTRPAFNFEAFAEKAFASADLVWNELTMQSAYATLPETASYCVAGSGTRAIQAVDVEGAGSQFFRRVVAGLCAKPDGWDYRRFAYKQNIQETISTFRQLENLASRGR